VFSRCVTIAGRGPVRERRPAGARWLLRPGVRRAYAGAASCAR